MSLTGPQPSIFISHGGGPCFWMKFPEPLGPHAFDGLKHYLSSLLKTLPQAPSAILLISAHWEESVPTLGASPAPKMIYDYYGFPEHTYQLQYPASGSPALAHTAKTLLKNAGITASLSTERGFDHGVFVPMLIIDPAAQIPVVTLSLQKNLNAAEHIAIGNALAPLRDNNILIIGSGNSYHNLRDFFDGSSHQSAEFDEWLTQTITEPDPEKRNERLAHWHTAPQARACHPREEHLLPLMVVAGAGATDQAQCDFHDVIGGKHISGYRFG